jgi:hypothetical protein
MTSKTPFLKLSKTQKTALKPKKVHGNASNAPASWLPSRRKNQFDQQVCAQQPTHAENKS